MIIDILLLLVIAYGFYLGFTRGIIKTIFSILAYVVGLVAAIKFSPAMTDLLEATFSTNSPFMYVAGLIVSFVLTMFLFRLLARGLEGLLQTVHVNILNQVAGGALLSAVMILVYSLLLWFADSSGILDAQTKRDSVSYAYLEDYPTYAWSAGQKLKPLFMDFWDHTVTFLDQVSDQAVERTESDPTYYDYDLEEENYNDRQE